MNTFHMTESCELAVGGVGVGGAGFVSFVCHKIELDFDHFWITKIL